MNARGVSGSKNRAEVMWILDAVEDDDQGGTTGIANQFFNAVINGYVVNVSDDALMNTALGEAIKQMGIDPLHLHAALGGHREQFVHPAAPALANANDRDASGTQGLQHRIDAVDDHCRLASTQSRGKRSRAFARAHDAPDP